MDIITNRINEALDQLDPDAGIIHREDLSKEEARHIIAQLRALYEPARSIDPEVLISIPEGNFKITAELDHYLLGNRDNPNEGNVKISEEDLWERLGIAEATPEDEPEAAAADTLSEDTIKKERRNQGAQIAIILVGVILILFNVLVVFPTMKDQSLLDPPYRAISPGTELRTLENQYQGIFATGIEDGDIILDLEGSQATVYELYEDSGGPNGLVLERIMESRFQFVKVENRNHLLIDEFGLVPLAGGQSLDYGGMLMTRRENLSPWIPN